MKTIFKCIFLVSVIFFLSACATRVSSQQSSWQLVFENDNEGNTLAGSKAELLSAIRSGKNVRVVTIGRSIDHASDAGFLSIYKGEVFAQIQAIESQRPVNDPIRIEFRTPGEKWRAIIGSNGFVTAYIDGSEPNIRTGRTKWYLGPVLLLVKK